MHKRYLIIPLLLALGLLVLQCAPSHAGRTIGRDMLQLEGNLGGPFVKNLGGAIPIPNIPIGLRYGVTDRLDVSGHVNLLPLVLGGFLHMDAGLTYGLVKNNGSRGWNLATGVGFLLLTDFQDGAIFSPTVDIAGGYTIEWFTVFVGAEFAFDFGDDNVIFDPYFGFEFDIRNFTLSTALYWFQPGGNSYASSLEYVAPDYQGAIGVMLGLKGRWDLGERRRRRSND